MRRSAGGDRGQVLLVAVLVLFGVATLAALFAAIVGAQIVQVTRYADVTELRNVAEAGLRFANEQLVYGAHGADWRPPRDPIQVGQGEVTLKVSYGPTPTELQKRFLLVSATATFRDNPFLSYTILGVKPLLLTDYARFITDREELRQPAALGVTGVELAGKPRWEYGGAYQFVITGPIRSNTDLKWYGPSRVDLYNALGTAGSSTWNSLGVLRDDRIEVAGEMRSGALLTGDRAQDQMALGDEPLQLWLNGTQCASNAFAPTGDKEQTYYLNGFFDILQFVNKNNYRAAANSWRVLAALPSCESAFGELLTPPDLSVPRVNPPVMDAVDPDLKTNRYLLLTRDSGRWFTDSSGNYVNTGEFGWGWVDYGGIYIDNTRDIQYDHNLEALRQNWVGSYTVPKADTGGQGARADGTVNWWDKTGRYYAPPGVEIILHGEAPNCPYVEVIRHDLRSDGGAVHYWCDQRGQPIPAGTTMQYAPEAGRCARPDNLDNALSIVGKGDRAIFPFPPNGVIYAEGNVRIRGIMPPNRIKTSSPQPYFPANPVDTAWRDGQKRRYRNYDLQVVSGGTIYVEGDLLTAASAKLYPPGTTEVVTWDRDNGSRVALIARDYVCLNTTALHPRPVNLYVTDENGQHSDDTFNDSQPVYPAEDGYPQYMLFQGPDLAAPPPPPAGRKERLRRRRRGGGTGDEPIPTTPASAGFSYTNVRLQVASLANETYLRDLRLIMGHSGWYTHKDQGGDFDSQTQELNDGRAAVDVQLEINGVVRKWQKGSDTYTFRSANPSDDESLHWYLELSRHPPPGDLRTLFEVDDYLEWLPLLTPVAAQQDLNNLQLTGADSLVFSAWVTPVWDDQEEKWILSPDELGYVLGPLSVTPPRWDSADKKAIDPLPVRVEAMVYAQNGSWFILPGPWFNEDPDEMPPPDLDTMQKIQKWFNGRVAPAYHEPLNLQLTFYGAITENMPAPVGDVADWTSKWSGMYRASAAADSAYLRYEYDPLLRWATRKDGLERLYPRFPNLPLTPDLLIWGERVSGFAGG